MLRDNQQHNIPKIVLLKGDGHESVANGYLRLPFPLFYILILSISNLWY